MTSTKNEEHDSALSELEQPSIIFTDLPVEIQLNILSNLPVKEIQRARAISKHLRNLVDQPANNSSLSSAIIIREIERIQALVSFATDYKNIDFLEALRRFHSFRGIWVDVRLRHRVDNAFANLWWQQQPAMAAKTNPMAAWDAQLSCSARYIFMLSYILVDLEKHSHSNYADYFPPYGASLPTCVGYLEAMKPEDGGVMALGDSSGRVAEFCERIGTTQGGYLQARYITDPTIEKPEWPVTNRIKYESTPVTIDAPVIEEDNICLSHTFAELFGVSGLPDYASNVFAYCVRSEWAHKEVRKAVDGEVLGSLAKAAILEELYLF